MYTRSYYPDGGKMNLPDNYDGTAFVDESAESPERHQEQSQACENTPCSSAEPLRIPFLSSLFGTGGIHIPQIGIEEILILATAAFLFFSKDGDKESAIILLLLLLVS